MTSFQRAAAEYREAYRLHMRLVGRYGRKEVAWSTVAKSAAALRLARATALVEREASQ